MIIAIESNLVNFSEKLRTEWKYYVECFWREIHLVHTCSLHNYRGTITYVKEVRMGRVRLIALWRSKKYTGQCSKLPLRSERGLVFAVIKVFIATYTCTNSRRRRISSFICAYLHEGNAIAVLVIHVYKRSHRTIAFRFNRDRSLRAKGTSDIHEKLFHRNIIACREVFIRYEY